MKVEAKCNIKIDINLISNVCWCISPQLFDRARQSPRQLTLKLVSVSPNRDFSSFSFLSQEARFTFQQYFGAVVNFHCVVDRCFNPHGLGFSRNCRKKACEEETWTEKIVSYFPRTRLFGAAAENSLLLLCKSNRYTFKLKFYLELLWWRAQLQG